jgi:hypothetical protein
MSPVLSVLMQGSTLSQDKLLKLLVFALPLIPVISICHTGLSQPGLFHTVHNFWVENHYRAGLEGPLTTLCVSFFQEELGGAILPKVVPLSSENLDNDGIFLLENGEDGFFYVGRQASSEILHQLFGVQSVEEVVSGQVKSSPFILTCIPLKVAIQQ